jgi:hypothetical protein
VCYAAIMKTNAFFWLNTRKDYLNLFTVLLLASLPVSSSLSATKTKSQGFESRQYVSESRLDFDPEHTHQNGETMEPTTSVTISITGGFYRFLEVPPVVVGAGDISRLFSTYAEAERAVALAQAKNPLSTYSIFRVDAKGRAT